MKYALVALPSVAVFAWFSLHLHFKWKREAIERLHRQTLLNRELEADITYLPVYKKRKPNA